MDKAKDENIFHSNIRINFLFRLWQVDKTKIKEQAELTAKSLLEDDYETLLRFTYPKVIEMVGGEDKMISLIKKGKVDMGQQGITLSR